MTKKNNQMKQSTLLYTKDDDVVVPQYETQGAAGFDLTAHSFLKLYEGTTEIPLSILKSIEKDKKIMLKPGQRVLVGTGLYVVLPDGYELQIRTRSGIALKQGLIVANSPGTVDEDYRGEVGVILLNTSNSPVAVELGSRIAQGVLNKVEQTEWMIIDKEQFDLYTTKRGEGGFGSTNK